MKRGGKGAAETPDVARCVCVCVCVSVSPDVARCVSVSVSVSVCLCVSRHGEVYVSPDEARCVCVCVQTWRGMCVCVCVSVCLSPCSQGSSHVLMGRESWWLLLLQTVPVEPGPEGPGGAWQASAGF